MKMKIQAMYLPKEHESLMTGFVVTKSIDSINIAVVDPDLDSKKAESEIKDVQYASLSVINPLNNIRLLKCLEHAKQSVKGKEWDAMRNEAIQMYQVGALIPDSAHFNV